MRVHLLVECGLPDARPCDVYVPDDLVIYLLWPYFRRELERQGVLALGVPMQIKRVEGEPLRRDW